MVKAKAAAADVRIPQNRDEAAAMIAEYGAAARELMLLEAELKETLANAKKDVEDRAKPHMKKALDLFRGLQTFCEANRKALLGDSGTKTVNLGTGTVSWRHNPPKVRLTGEHDDIIARIVNAAAEATDRGDDTTSDSYLDFLRTKQEVDKEAMLKNAELARTIEGVSVGRAGEVFAVEPFGAELSESAA